MNRKLTSEVITALKDAYDENNAEMAKIHQELVRLSQLPSSDITTKHAERLAAAEESLRQAREYAGQCLRKLAEP